MNIWKQNKLKSFINITMYGSLPYTPDNVASWNEMKNKYLTILFYHFHITQTTSNIIQLIALSDHLVHCVVFFSYFREARFEKYMIHTHSIYYIPVRYFYWHFNTLSFLWTAFVCFNCHVSDTFSSFIQMHTIIKTRNYTMIWHQNQKSRI